MMGVEKKNHRKGETKERERERDFQIDARSMGAKEEDSQGTIKCKIGGNKVVAQPQFGRGGQSFCCSKKKGWLDGKVLGRLRISGGCIQRVPERYFSIKQTEPWIGLRISDEFLGSMELRSSPEYLLLYSVT